MGRKEHLHKEHMRLLIHRRVRCEVLAVASALVLLYSSAPNAPSVIMSAAAVVGR
ncbi:hypothetical protein BOTBODRAFT_496258 [Botryobasidium botryosum FD-172 SS1]|uniref:Uncharacterized protein n=1 Tax=Botryobasidium botryosum (strain FD-172 SS1) TaxID=930990 RepID=A0A067M6V7_BOTB1|nr:hypothetical protein BOTBODRAFT_496258 [Botryobasidium botryosum FD-172 SS1]